MKRFISCLLIISVFLPCASAITQSGYDTRTVFYDGDYVVSAAGAGGTLYALRASGLYAIASDGSETQTAPSGDVTAGIDTLMSDGQALYGRGLFGPLPLVLLVDEAGRYVNRVLLEADPDEARLTYQAFLKEGQLFYMTDQSASLTILSLETGEKESFPLPDVILFDAIEDGQLIALTREIRWPDVKYHLVKFDPRTGESVLWAEADSDRRFQRLIYDDETRTAYLFAQTEILSVKERSTAQVLDGFINGDLMSASLLSNGAALVVDGILVIRNFAGGQIRRLSVLEEHGRGEDYRNFIQDHPLVDLQFASSFGQAPEERFAQDMITRNGGIDVFILSDINLLRQIKKKAYYVDMAGNADIKALTDDMYAPFRSALMSEKKIVAFPKQLFVEVLCYHKESFESLGFAPPSTYEEYMDFCLRWIDEFAEIYPEFSLNPFANDLSHEALFMRRADEKARDGEALRFNTEDMARLIGKYLVLMDAWKASGDDGRRGTPLFYSYAIPLLGADGAYAYLPLSFNKKVQPLIGLAKNEFRYFVINPYGENPDDALAFVAASEAQRLEVQKALLYQSIDEPMESAYFRSERAAQEQELQTLEAMKEKAEPLARRGIETQIQQYRMMMEDFEKTSHWALSQSALDIYKGLAHLVYINEFNPVVDLFDDTPELFDSAEALSIPRFLETLDSKINLILLENDALHHQGEVQNQ